MTDGGGAAGVVRAVVFVSLVTGCATLQQLAALRQVRFDLEGVTGTTLAGVDLARVESYADLTPSDVVKLGAAVARGSLPLGFVLGVRAENPSDNAVSARMTRLQWSLFLQDTETINGVVDQPVDLAPGEPHTIPVRMELDVMEFFDGSARSLVDLVLAGLGQNPEPTTIRLTAVPTVETPIGPIAYPAPITIVSRTVR